MSLYKYTIKPCQFDENPAVSSDDEEKIPRGKRLKTNTKASVHGVGSSLPTSIPVKRSTSDLICLPSDDSDQDDADDVKLPAQLVEKAPTVESVDNYDTSLDADGENFAGGDQALLRARNLLRQLSQPKISAQNIHRITADVPVGNNTSSSADIFIPSVKSARERERKTSTVSHNSAEISVDYLSGVLGIVAAPVVVQSTANLANKIKLKTRCNGQHEWKFLVDKSQTFGKMKQKFADIYSLKTGDVRFEFDGETLKDKESPSSLDMDDDDIIEVKIHKDKYKVAVAAAEASKLNASAGLVTTSSSASAGDSDNNKLKLKTRCNGKHEWKFLADRSHSFEKLKQKFAEIYGLALKEIRFEFDGDTLNDKDTPQALDMEDGNIIDVKINKDKYTAAVATAEASKLNKDPEITQPISATPPLPSALPLAAPLPSASLINDNVVEKNRNYIIEINASSSVSATSKMVVVATAEVTGLSALSTFQDIYNDLVNMQYIKKNQLVEFSRLVNGTVTIFEMTSPLSTLSTDAVDPSDSSIAGNIKLLLHPARITVDATPDSSIPSSKKARFLIRADFKLNQLLAAMAKQFKVDQNSLVVSYQGNNLRNGNMTCEDLGMTSGCSINVTLKK